MQYSAIKKQTGGNDEDEELITGEIKIGQTRIKCTRNVRRSVVCLLATAFLSLVIVVANNSNQNNADHLIKTSSNKLEDEVNKKKERHIYINLTIHTRSIDTIVLWRVCFCCCINIGWTFDCHASRSKFHLPSRWKLFTRRGTTAKKRRRKKKSPNSNCPSPIYFLFSR